jgi:hypothetical protein
MELADVTVTCAAADSTFFNMQHPVSVWAIPKVYRNF